MWWRRRSAPQLDRARRDLRGRAGPPPSGLETRSQRGPDSSQALRHPTGWHYLARARRDPPFMRRAELSLGRRKGGADTARWLNRLGSRPLDLPDTISEIMYPLRRGCYRKATRTPLARARLPSSASATSLLHLHSRAPPLNIVQDDRADSSTESCGSQSSYSR